MRIHYRTITSCRELPPKWRVVSENTDNEGPNRYLQDADTLSQHTHADLGYASSNDLVGAVFGQQLFEHEIQARHLARLLYDRHRLTREHLHELDRQLYELRSLRPLRPTGPGAPYVPAVTDLDRQIFNLERQKRALEVAHWRDTQELRTALIERRTEQQGTQRRLGYLGGGYGAGR